jgi:serralysin
VIKAFVSGQDVIDLSGIDTDAGAGGDQTFAWAGAGNVAAAFTGRKGELRFADGILQGDLDGDGGPTSRSASRARWRPAT